MFSRHNLLLVWKETQHYFIIAAILFFAGVYVGYSDHAPVEWLKSQIEALQKAVQSTEGADRREQAMFFMILSKNMQAAFMAMILGMIGGFMPIVVLVMNGIVMGFVVGQIFTTSGFGGWEYVAKLLLPHGIIELAAIFLACAFGIRLGISLFRGIWGALIGKSVAWQPFSRTVKGAIPGIVVITVMLVIAALIESTITYWLAQSLTNI